MFVKIHSAKNYGNTGSCMSVVQYLEKENEEVELRERLLFFDQSNQEISHNTVVKQIDRNCAKLGKEDARFFMVSINPSQEEMKHMAYQITGRRINELSKFTKVEKRLFEHAMREYTRNVMDIYAENFNKQLTGSDLLYYGKIEHERKYNRFDNLVKNGTKKQGELKEGFQSHVHVIVSRKDITNTKKLSPFANHKNSKNILNGKEVQIGFNRKEFVEKCEKHFDLQFGFDRLMVHSFHYRYTRKNAAAQVARSYGRYISTNLVTGYETYSRASLTIKGLSQEDPLKRLSTIFWQNKESANLLRAMRAASSPERLVIEVAKKIPSTMRKIASLNL